MEPGYKFPQGPKDAIASSIGKIYGPGPGSHSPALPKYGMGKRILGGSLSSKELIDNGVPGPGQYYSDSNFSIPSYKIVEKTPLNEKQKFKINERAGIMNVGPQSYDPKVPQES